MPSVNYFHLNAKQKKGHEGQLLISLLTKHEFKTNTHTDHDSIMCQGGVCMQISVLTVNCRLHWTLTLHHVK